MTAPAREWRQVLQKRPAVNAGGPGRSEEFPKLFWEQFSRLLPVMSVAALVKLYPTLAEAAEVRDAYVVKVMSK